MKAVSGKEFARILQKMDGSKNESKAVITFFANRAASKELWCLFTAIGHLKSDSRNT